MTDPGASRLVRTAALAILGIAAFAACSERRSSAPARADAGMSRGVPAGPSRSPAQDVPVRQVAMPDAEPPPVAAAVLPPAVGSAERDAVAPAAEVPVAGLPSGFPMPDGTCPQAAPHPDAAFREAAVTDVDGPAEGAQLPAAGARLTVVSYNVWELYDGRDGDRYLGRRDHPEGESLDVSHAGRRVAALADVLAGVPADVIVLQEVEGAAVACALARLAFPDADWRCWAARWAREPHPQNVAIASRVAGQAVALDPGRGMGLRGALEFAVDGLPLRIAAVHLKSSVGASGERDCGNATKRMAVAYGLFRRQREASGVAYLVIGDLNVDPDDAARAPYDRTDDILELDGAEDLVERFGATSGGRSTIDRAFLRSRSGLEAEALRFAADAPLRGWTSDHRPLVVTLRTTEAP